MSMAPCESVTRRPIVCAPSGSVVARISPNPRSCSPTWPGLSNHSKDTMSSLLFAVESGSVEDEPSRTTCAPPLPIAFNLTRYSERSMRIRVDYHRRFALVEEQLIGAHRRGRSIRRGQDQPIRASRFERRDVRFVRQSSIKRDVERGSPPYDHAVQEKAVE